MWIHHFLHFRPLQLVYGHARCILHAFLLSTVVWQSWSMMSGHSMIAVLFRLKATIYSSWNYPDSSNHCWMASIYLRWSIDSNPKRAYFSLTRWFSWGLRSASMKAYFHAFLPLCVELWLIYAKGTCFLCAWLLNFWPIVDWFWVCLRRQLQPFQWQRWRLGLLCVVNCYPCGCTAALD